MKHFEKPSVLIDVPITTTASPIKNKGQCRWVLDEDYWETSCGEAFCLNEGTPSDNDFEFCPYCGKSLVEFIDNFRK